MMIFKIIFEFRDYYWICLDFKICFGFSFFFVQIFFFREMGNFSDWCLLIGNDWLKKRQKKYKSLQILFFIIFCFWFLIFDFFFLQKKYFFFLWELKKLKAPESFRTPLKKRNEFFSNLKLESDYKKDAQMKQKQNEWMK